MGLAGTYRLFALMLAMIAASCSPYYSFLPELLTYKISERSTFEPPPPDPVAIASAELRSLIASGDPHDIAVGSARRGPQGWSFCLTAKVSNAMNGAIRKQVYWVTALSPGIYSRRTAEPADQCDIEQYTSVNLRPKTGPMTLAMRLFMDRAAVEVVSARSLRYFTLPSERMARRAGRSMHRKIRAETPNTASRYPASTIGSDRSASDGRFTKIQRDSV